MNVLRISRRVEAGCKRPVSLARLLTSRVTVIASSCNTMALFHSSFLFNFLTILSHGLHACMFHMITGARVHYPSQRLGFLFGFGLHDSSLFLSSFRFFLPRSTLVLSLALVSPLFAPSFPFPRSPSLILFFSLPLFLLLLLLFMNGTCMTGTDTTEPISR